MMLHFAMNASTPLIRRSRPMSVCSRNLVARVKSEAKVADVAEEAEEAEEEVLTEPVERPTKEESDAKKERKKMAVTEAKAAQTVNDVAKYREVDDRGMAAILVTAAYLIRRTSETDTPLGKSLWVLLSLLKQDGLYNLLVTSMIMGHRPGPSHIKAISCNFSSDLIRSALACIDHVVGTQKDGLHQEFGMITEEITSWNLLTLTPMPTVITQQPTHDVLVTDCGDFDESVGDAMAMLVMYSFKLQHRRKHSVKDRRDTWRLLDTILQQYPKAIHAAFTISVRFGEISTQTAAQEMISFVPEAVMGDAMRRLSELLLGTYILDGTHCEDVLPLQDMGDPGPAPAADERGPPPDLIRIEMQPEEVEMHEKRMLELNELLTLQMERIMRLQ